MTGLWHDSGRGAYEAEHTSCDCDCFRYADWLAVARLEIVLKRGVLRLTFRRPKLGGVDDGS